MQRVYYFICLQEKLDSLGILPIHQILSYLDADDLLSVAQCCKYLYELVNSNIFWKRFCIKKNWIKYGVYNKMNQPMIDHALSSELSRFSLVNLNHEGIEFFNLSPMCFWRQVYIKGLYLRKNWKSGRYSLHNVSINRFSNDKVVVMDFNDYLLVIGTNNRQMLIYELHSFKYVNSINLHQDITCLSFKSDTLIIGFSSGDVYVYDALEIINCNTFTGESCAVSNVLQLQDRICGIYCNRQIYVWSLLLNSVLFTLNGHTDEIFCLTSFTDRWLVTGSWDCKAIIWDVENGFMAVQLSDHTEAVSCVKMNREYVVTGAFDGNVRIWKWQESRLLNVLVGSKEIYCLDINNSRIAAAGSDSFIFIWNWDGSQLFKLAGHLGIIRHIKFLNETNLISAGDMRRIMIWDIYNGCCDNVLYRNPLQIGKFLVNDYCVIVASDNVTPHICVLSFL